MTGVYRACVGLLLVVFLPAIWIVPWFWNGHGYRRYGKEYVLAAFLVFPWALVRSRKCGGILWCARSRDRS